MYTLENRHLFECAREDRVRCIKTRDLVLEFAELARSQGLLAFEVQGKELEPFQVKMLNFMVDGLECNYIRKYMEAAIIADGHTGLRLLEQYVFFEGMMSILEGTHPRVIEEQLNLIIGLDVIKYAKEMKKEQLEREFISAMDVHKLKVTIDRMAGKR